MVSHCANPNCKVPFHYLRGGRLYRFDIKSPQMPCADVPNAICSDKPSRATVYFWMCMDCCRRFSLKFDPCAGVELISLANPAQVGNSPVVVEQAVTLSDQHTA
jgi:hypothetical protein